jgi:hypothetical protein
MPKKKFVNETVEGLSAVLPLVARGSRVLPVEQVHSSVIVNVVIETLRKYPDDMKDQIDSLDIVSPTWVLTTRDEKIVSQVWNNRVALHIAGYVVNFFIGEEPEYEDGK